MCIPGHTLCPTGRILFDTAPDRDFLLKGGRPARCSMQSHRTLRGRVPLKAASQPSTLNPQPSTLNPQPSTHNPQAPVLQPKNENRGRGGARGHLPGAIPVWLRNHVLATTILLSGGVIHQVASPYLKHKEWLGERGGRAVCQRWGGHWISLVLAASIVISSSIKRA